jgi:hypothetical protein
MVTHAEGQLTRGPRLYPPLLTGDFNATLRADQIELQPGAPFDRFEIAGWPVDPKPGEWGDVVGVLKGKLADFPARDSGGVMPQILPVDSVATPYCGTPDIVWSDHCGVFVQIVPTQTLPPAARAPAPPLDDGGDEPDPVCERKRC